MNSTNVPSAAIGYSNNQIGMGIKVLLFVALFLAGTSGLSFTMSTLREFGTRPVNLVLAGILVVGLVRTALGARVELPSYALYSAFAFLIILPLNLIILFIHVEPVYGVHLPLTAWLFQFLIFGWLPCAILAWFLLLKDAVSTPENIRTFFILVAAAACVHIVFFVDSFLSFISFLGVAPINGIIPDALWEVLTTANDPRATGLNTEPSHYATWMVWCWPFLVLAPRNLFKKWEWLILVSIGLLVLLTSLMSGARTGLMILGFQTASLVACVFLLKIGSVRNRIILAALCILALFIGFIFGWSKITSVFDVRNNLSSAMRWGSFVGTWRMFNDSPIWGVGLGGHAANFAYYFPAFGQVSTEFYNFTQGVNLEFRPNASSFYLRVGAELGIFALLALLVLIVGPLVHVFSQTLQTKSQHHPLFFPVLIAGAGTLITWVATDETLYPGASLIAALALAITSTHAHDKDDQLSPTMSE